MKFCYIFLIIFIIFSCKTTTEPIIYNKDIEKIDKDAELIQILIQNKNYIEAENKIEKNLALYPGNIDILALKAWMQLQQGNLEESKNLFTDILNKKRQNPLVMTGLARINRINQDYESAEELIAEGLAYMPGNSYLWLEKGIIDYEKNEYKKALLNFNKAYALDNKNTDAYFFKYITMIKLGRELDEIKQYWDNILKRNNLQSWYFQYHAAALYEKNLKTYAILVINEGLKVFSNDPYLLNIYAYILYKDYILKKDESLLTDAKNYIENSLKSNVINPDFLDTYFLILEASGDTEKLNNDIQKYLLIFPDSEIILNWLEKTNKKSIK